MDYKIIERFINISSLIILGAGALFAIWAIIEIIRYYIDRSRKDDREITL